MRNKIDLSMENLEAMSPEETLQMIHEMQVRQIELEMQNDELRRMQADFTERSLAGGGGHSADC